MSRRNLLLAITTSVVSKKNYNYMTIYALEDGLQAKLSGNTISYSLDKGNTWTSLASNTYTPTVNSGQTIMFKGNLTPNSSNGIGTFTISKKCNLEGNCMSLLFGDDAMNNYSLSGKSYAFYNLFSGCTTIMQVSESFLPATTLDSYCYSYMFNKCTSLTTAPSILPATTLISYCYRGMFFGCSSLTTSPELPATTLAKGCYQYMFRDCTSLTIAPELPATTLAEDCYYYMFGGTNALPDCSNIDFTSNAVVSSVGLNGLFAGTKVTDNDLYNILPINPATGKYWLPATTLASNCYNYMFYGCSNLTTTPELPATTLANYCYYYMFYGCTSLTIAPELPATTLAISCYSNMFYNCTSLTTAPELSATTLASYCYEYMFRGCSSLTTSPELPATTLANNCYYNMFYDCNKLNYIKMLATDISATNCLKNWVTNVSSNGTFVKNPAMTSLPTGNSGIPRGWTVYNDGEEPGGSSLTLPIKLYEGNNDLDAKLIIDYIKSLDTDGNGIVGGDDDGSDFLKNIINFNDLYYPYSCWIENDNISGGSWFCLSDDSNMGDVLGWRLNLDGTLVVEWD